MGFSLDNYINGKKKKTGQPTGSFHDDFVSGRMGQGQPKAGRAPSPSSVTSPTGGRAGGGGGFSLDNYIQEKGIRAGKLQQQDNDFNSWLEDVQRFSGRVSGEFSQRQSAYQAPETFRAYRDKTGAEISELLKRAYTAQGYYTQYGKTYDEVHGQGTTAKLLEGVRQNIDYLEGVRKGLQSEQEWWDGFQDEADFDSYQRFKGYGEIPQAADFGEKSQYKSTRKSDEEIEAGRGPLAFLVPQLDLLDFGDISYDYINRNPEALEKQAHSDIDGGLTLAGLDNSERREMTDEEIAIFNYIYATQSPEAAYQYISDMTAELNSRQRQTVEAEWRKYADADPVGSSVFSLLTSPAKGLSYIGQAVDYLDDGKIDQNAGYNKFSYIPSAIRGQVSQGIEEKVEGFWGKAGSFAYQTGMSMGDFLLNTAITGGNQALTLAIMGTGAAADGTIAAKDRGLSDNQAFALGTIAGLAEVVTEKVSLEALLKPDWEKGVLNYIIKNAVAEGSEEVASDAINLVADVLISKEKSEWAQSIQAYMADGYSEAEATGKAVWDQAISMGVDFLGGALSGGIMSSAAGTGHVMTNYQSGRQFSGMDLSAEDIQTFINEGLASDSSTQAYKLAAAAQQKLAAGGTLTTYELGNLYQANVRAIGMEDDGAALLEQAAQDIAEGKRMTNRKASAILDSPSALRALAEEAGLSISDDMSKSQKRDAVRSAVTSLARPAVSVADAQATRGTVEDAQPSTAHETPVERKTARRAPAEQVWSDKRLDAALDALGEQGKVQGKAFFDSATQDPVAYYGGFAAYYEAGVSGMDMGKVQSRYASVLNDAQRQAAYLAGQEDAAASLRAEQERTPFATVYGKEAGFIQSDVSATLPKSTTTYFNNLARATGVKIQMAPSTGSDGANGWYANGIVNIAMDAEDPGMVVATHEITHRMQELSPKEYRAYRDYAMKLMDRKGGLHSTVEAYRARYAEAGQNLTTEQAMDEIAADFTEDLLRDVEGFKELAGADRNVAQKLLDAVRDFIRKVKAFFKGNKAAQDGVASQAYGVSMDELEEAARLWGEALKASKEAARSGGSVVGTEGGYARASGRFSLKGVVEESDTLIALHNLTEDKLLKSLALGGFPMPSIAVTKTSIPHTNFGDITLVMDKSTIDPEFDRRNMVYSADAWTPTFPSTEYEVNQKVADRLRSKYYELFRAHGREAVDALYPWGNYPEDQLNRVGGEKAAIAKFQDDTDMMKVYLVDKGMQVPDPVVTETVERMSDGDIAMYDHMISELGENFIREAGGEGGNMPPVIRKDWYEQHGDTVEAAYRSFLERIGFSADEIENAMDARTRQDNVVLVKNASRYLKDGPEKRSVSTDVKATADAIRRAVNQEDYHAWLHDLFGGIEKSSGIYNGKERYTPSGDLRSFKSLHLPVTLDNITKAMVAEGKGDNRNVSGFYGVKSLRASIEERFSSIENMHELEGRLQHLTEEEAGQISDALQERLYALMDKIYNTKPHSQYSNYLMDLDAIGNILMEAARAKKITIDSIIKEFSGSGYKISVPLATELRDLFFDISQMPVNIFEAKPERSVRFDEVLAAIIPDTSSDELRSKLEEAGVRTMEYPAGDDAARMDIANGVEGARFSLKRSRSAQDDLAAMRRQNLELRERLAEYRGIAQEAKQQKERADYWQGQTRRTKRATTDAKAVKAAAQALIRDTYSTMALQDIQGDLQSLYDYIASGEEVTGEEVWSRAREIAEALVRNAEAVDTEYDDLLSYLRSVQLNLGKEFNSIDDFGDFRKRYFGKLRIGTKGTNIDQVYIELSNMWPEFFDEKKHSHPSDQLEHIAEVVDQIAGSRESNPYSGYMEAAIDGAANEIIEQFFDLPQTKATMADRWAAKVDAAKAKGRAQVQKVREQKNAQIEALRKENRQRVKDAIERERAAASRRLDAVKDRYAAKDQKGRERRSSAELRRKITKHSKALSEKLLHPTDKKHIPEELRGAVAAMLEAINQESQYSVDPETGKRAKNQNGDPTKRTEAFRALREQYEAISKGRTDFTGVLDPDLLDNLAEVIAMRDVRLADMTTAQLSTVWQVVRAVEQSVSTVNKLLGQSRFEGVKELAEGISFSSASRRTKGNWRGLAGWADRLLNLDMMNPLTFFHQFGEGGDALYHEMQVARDHKTRILAETTDHVQRVIGKTDINKLREETHTFRVEGGEITLTTAQIMSLYELSKREQAQEHIYKGGLRASPIETGVDKSKSAKANIAAALGKLDAPAAGVRVSLDDVANILSVLTDEQVKIADGLQGIMQEYLAREGNRESMKVYGYEKFGEANYFPISSDPHQVQDKIGDVLEGGQKRPKSIAEWGSAKATTAKANNGLLLGDIFDVFAQHAVDMATYASHLGVMEDVNRVRNFTFRNAEGERIGTMGDIIQRVTGQGGGAYLNKLLQDVSSGTAKESVTGLGKLTANYKAASVGANIRVALQQPTAYLRAAAVIDAKYLADPRVLKKGGWAKALKYAPIAVWKDWGNFEINQGRQLQNIMFNTDSKLERARNAAMWLAGEMDSVTWGRIWNACELEVMDTMPGLARGSTAFYEAVSQRFTDIIDQTQVVDNVLGRSQIMRSSDSLSKMATSYMGEPTQSYNLVYRALRDLTQEQNNAKRTAAKKVLGRAVVALTASQFVNAIAQALWDAVRDDDDRDKKYWERVLGHIPGNFADNISPVGMVPYIKDVVSVLQGYDVKRMDMEAITSFISACQNMGKAINGEGRYTLAGAGANLLAETARIFGLPIATVKRDMVAVARTVGIETGNWYFQYQLERALNSVGYSGNRGEFYDIAWGALRDGEMDVYQAITQDLMAQGVKASTIESAMRERLKKAREVDVSFSLDQQALDLIGSRDSYGTKATEERGGFTSSDLSPAEYQRFNAQRAASYRAVMNELEGFPTFGSLDGNMKDKAITAADTLTEKLALEAVSAGAYTADTKWMQWASGGAEAGVSEAEAILFKTAYDMTSGDTDGEGKTISGSKKENVLEAALEMMPWLTDEELEYLMGNFWK